MEFGTFVLCKVLHKLFCLHFISLTDIKSSWVSHDQVCCPPLSQRDHAGGNEQLVSMVPGLTVCGNDDRIGAMNKRVKDGDQFKVTLNS